jgi:LysM repeat protein
MKLISSCAMIFFIASFGFAAEPIIEFRGVMVGDGATKLSLVDKSSDTTRWVEVGQVFLGYTVKGYDVKTETATLTRMGKDYQIRINTSKIEEAPNEPISATVLPLEIVHAIRNNLRQISAASDQFFLETGKKTVTLAELVGPTKYIKELKTYDGENYNSLQLSQGTVESLKVTTQSGLVVSMEPTIVELTPNQLEYPNSNSHVIAPGETAQKIAERYHVSVANLTALNPGVDWNKLRVGAQVRVK